MSSRDDGPPPGFSDRTSSGRRAVDWILAGLLVILGFAVVAIGGLLYRVADRDWIADLIADETIESDIITKPELVDLLFAGSLWGGIGIMLAGGVMILGGIAFGVGRYRIDQADTEVEPPTFRANALLGAFVSAVTSFVPLSGILGGGVAGYLQTDDNWSGALVGALSGLLLAIPVVVVAGVLLFGLAAEGLAVFALFGLFLLLFALAFSIGLSAIGGAIGSYLRKNQ